MEKEIEIFDRNQAEEQFQLQNSFLESRKQKIDEFKQDIRDGVKEKFIKNAAPKTLLNFPEEKKLIILIDIVGFSKSETREQVYDIYLFQKYLRTMEIANRLNFLDGIRIQNFIPTGDGCYIIADDCDPEPAVNFLLDLISGFQILQNDEEEPISLRVSALLGNCVPFMDIARHKNYIGEGMNEAARILSGGQKILEETFVKETQNPVQEAKIFSRNSLYVGDSLAQQLEKESVKGNKLYKFTAVPDKHGKTRNITVLQGIS